LNIEQPTSNIECRVDGHGAFDIRCSAFGVRRSLLGRLGAACAAILVLAATACEGGTGDLAILSFETDGMLSWTNALSNATYQVEWASTPTGAWHASWSVPGLVANTAGVTMVDVPMYYRIASAPRQDFVTEAFGIAAGANGYVAGSTQCPFDDQAGKYFFGPIVVEHSTNLVESTTTNATFTLVKQFSGLNTRLHRLENEGQAANPVTGYAECKAVFHYGDGSSSTVTHTFSSWRTEGYTNANPAKTVTDVNIWLRCVYTMPMANTAHERNDRLYGYTNLPSVNIDLDLPALTGMVTHAMLHAETPDRQAGDGICYALSDGSASMSNLSLNTQYPLSALGTNPTSLSILLSPAGQNPAPETPSVKGIGLLYWAR